VEVAANNEAIAAWNGVLFDRWNQFRHTFGEGLSRFDDQALARHPPRPGERVLDVGCGLGDTSQRIAGLVGDRGAVLGIDAAPRFVEEAGSSAAAGGVTNVDFEVADVQAEVPGSGFDLAYSRMGTMFFDNPVPAMRNIRGALLPGGRLCMIVWRQKPDNELFHLAELITERYLDHPESTDELSCGLGPFSMANADTTSGILQSAGFEQVSLQRCDTSYKMGSNLDEAVAFTTAIGPAGELIRLNEERGEALRPKIEAEIRAELEPLLRPDGVWGGASTWIVSAANPV
jgi:ubiquinone/menaquinone biosynthesis C-methylase UbiE